MGLIALGFLFLLNRGDDSPGSATGSDYVLVCYRKEIAFFDSELDTEPSDVLHIADHF
jgi:hypothetical protein